MTFMSRFLVVTALVCAPLFSMAYAQDAKPAGAPPAAVQDKTLTVFAAASMKNALDEANATYTAKTGVRVVSSYAASSALAKQLEQGAPADIFISADTDWMDYSAGKKTISEPSRVNLLGNKISPSSQATAGSPPATSRPCRSANTPRQRWKSSVRGTLPRRSSPWLKASAPHSHWSRAAKPISASCMRPTPRSNPA